MADGDDQSAFDRIRRQFEPNPIPRPRLHRPPTLPHDASVDKKPVATVSAIQRQQTTESSNPSLPKPSEPEKQPRKIAPVVAERKKKDLLHSTPVDKPKPPDDCYGWPVPLCLIENDLENSTLFINKSTAERLAAIRDELVVVAIVGLYRTGKSYLMNHLAAHCNLHEQGFHVGNEVKAETKGIWIWCMRHPVKKDCCLVLLDTEGLSDVNKTNGAENDLMLFMMTTLISSVLVYNSVGTIDQTALDKVHFVNDLVDKIQLKTRSAEMANDEDDELGLREYFPSFIWVVRDFSLKLEANGKLITSDEYLEKALELKKGLGAEAQRTNRPRQLFRKCFVQRKCFTFPPFPQNERAANAAELLSQFNETAEEFCQHVLHTGDVKSVAGHAMDGKKFVHLVSQYANSISNNKTTVVWNVFDAAARQVNEEAIRESVELYSQGMMQLAMPVADKQVLEKEHEKCERMARSNFFKRAMLKTNEKEAVDQFAAAIVAKYNQVRDEDAQKSRNVCKQLLDNLYKEIKGKFDNGTYFTRGGHALYLADLEHMTQRYRNTPNKGIMVDDVLEKHQQKNASWEKAIKVIQDKMEEKEDPETEKMKRDLKAAVEAKEKAEAALTELEKKMAEVDKHMTAQTKALERLLALEEERQLKEKQERADVEVLRRKASLETYEDSQARKKAELLKAMQDEEVKAATKEVELAEAKQAAQDAAEAKLKKRESADEKRLREAAQKTMAEQIRLQEAQLLENRKKLEELMKQDRERMEAETL